MEEFETEIDGKDYLFKEKKKGSGYFYKKLKNGKFSKKKSGTYKEIEDGELDINWKKK